MKTKHYILTLLALTISAKAFADVPEGNITFTDSAVKAICVANWDTNSDGKLSYAEAAAVTDLGEVFKENTTITSFNELQYFTSLTAIGDYAFYGCSSLTSITIPNSVTSIGNRAFQNCSSLTSVAIPNSVTNIGYAAFASCSALTSVTIPNGVTSIGESAFQYCSGLTSIYIPESVTSIGAFVVSDCYNITSIIVSPDNLKYDSRDNCNAIIETATNMLINGCKNTIIPCSVTFINAAAFQNCSGLTTISIPEGVTSIEGWTFYGCSSLTSIDIPESVTSIKRCAFYGCSSLTDIIIPEDVTSILAYAFRGCSSLTSITIPENVASIEEYAFWACSDLTSVIVHSESPLSIPSNSFQDQANTTLYVPYGCKSAYEAADYWKDFKEIIELPIIPSGICGDNLTWTFDEGTETLTISGTGDMYDYELTSDVPWYGFKHLIKHVNIQSGATGIGNHAFKGCGKLTDITIPESVTRSGRDAFTNCNNLQKVIIPDIAAWCSINFANANGNPLSFSHHLFSDDTTEIKDLVIPDGVTSIKFGAFYGCSGLTSVTIPESVTSIGKSAFCYCSGLTSVTFEDDSQLISIGDYAFRSCSGLTSINIPESVTNIEQFTFWGCTSLTSITIPKNVTSIGKCAFCYCSGLTSVTIPESMTSIGYCSFYCCSGLTSINIPENVTSIGPGAFWGCSGLTSINIPENVTSIALETFWGCSGLTSITIPESVTSIENNAFRACSGLTSITIPVSVTSIGNYAFYQCSGLTSVIVNSESPVSITSTSFLGQTNITLYVPYGSKSAYEAADYWKDFKEIIEAGPVVVGNSGFATYCSPFDLDFSGITDIRAYVASGFNPATAKLVLTRVTEVPAGEGLYIVGTPGTYNIPHTTTSMFYANLMIGVTEATTISPTEGNKTNFILANGSHGVAFYTLSNAGEVAAGKAYLQIPTALVPEVKALKIIFEDDDDDPTGIAITSAHSQEDETIYNLAGQRVSTAQKGINIINGKKVIIK